MKKIILILVILLTTGCYDYVELNNISIVSSIGIDYIDNEFILTLEILDDNNSSYVVSTKGKTIVNAFDNASIIVNKIPYYYHLKALIISEEIAYNHLKEITDYFIRNPKIIHSFYLVMCKDITAKEFLNSKNIQVIGDEIENKMDNKIYEYSISYTDYFEDVMERLLNKRKDAMMTSFIINNNNIETYGIALFKDNKLVDILDKEESSLLNMLLSNSTNMTLENDDLIINIYDNKTDISFDNKIIINVSSEAQIVTNKNNNNLKKDESYLKFNDDFSKLLMDKLDSLINKLNNLNVDPLSIRWKYYQEYKKDLKDLDIKLIVNLKVNKKGLIFEANYE